MRHRDSHRLDVAGMVTRSIRLDDDAQAFEDMKAADAIRGVILI